MSDVFNPYFEWLAIECAQRPDHYALLGLARFESEPQRVVTAADERIAQLRKSASQDRLALAKRLAQEIIAARNCLLSAAERAAYDGQLRKKGGAPQSNVPGLALPPRAFDDDSIDEELALEGIALPPAPTAVAVPPAALLATPPVAEAIPVAELPPPEDRIVVQRQPNAPRRKPMSRLPLIVSGAAIALTGISAAVFVPQWLRPPLEPVVESVDGAGEKVVETVEVPSNPKNTESPVENADETTDQDHHPSQEIADSAPNTNAVEADLPATNESHDAAMNATEASQEASRSSVESSANQEMTKATLKLARKAMGKGDMDAAADYVDLADLEAIETRAAEFVAHDRAVMEYLKGFWRAVDGGFLQLEASDEFEWEKRTVVVVERTPERLSIRSAGKNVRFERKRLPPKLSVFLANRWLKPDDANTPLFLAAFHLLDGDGDRAEAKRLLEDARSAGTDGAADLLAELEVNATETP